MCPECPPTRPTKYWSDRCEFHIACSTQQEQVDEITQNFKSQQACITALAPSDALNAEKMLLHRLSWSSYENQQSLPQYFDG